MPSTWGFGTQKNDLSRTFRGRDFSVRLTEESWRDQWERANSGQENTLAKAFLTSGKHDAEGSFGGITELKTQPKTARTWADGSFLNGLQ